MDWTAFANIVSVLSGLVTIGSPIFSIYRAVGRNTQSRGVPHQPLSNKSGSVQPNAIPWYVWVKAVFYTFMKMIEEPMVILWYLIGGGLLLGAVYIICFLVGFPVGWLNEGTVGERMLLLFSLLFVSLHFSIVFAEHSDEFLRK